MFKKTVGCFGLISCLGATFALANPHLRTLAIADSTGEKDETCFSAYFDLNDDANAIILKGVKDLAVTVNGSDAYVRDTFRQIMQTGNEKTTVTDVTSGKQVTLKAFASFSFCIDQHIGELSSKTQDLVLHASSASASVDFTVKLKNNGIIDVDPLDDSDSILLQSLQLQSQDGALANASTVKGVSLTAFLPDYKTQHLVTPSLVSPAISQVRVPNGSISVYFYVLAHAQDGKLHYYTAQLPTGNLSNGMSIQLQDQGIDPNWN